MKVFFIGWWFCLSCKFIRNLQFLFWQTKRKWFQNHLNKCYKSNLSQINFTWLNQIHIKFRSDCAHVITRLSRNVHSLDTKLKGRYAMNYGKWNRAEKLSMKYRSVFNRGIKRKCSGPCYRRLECCRLPGYARERQPSVVNLYMSLVYMYVST